MRPEDITQTALLTVEGELDDISGSGQTEAAHKLCTGIPDSRSQHLEAEGAGHYGIFSGRRWRDLVYPRVRDFIQSHVAVRQTAASGTPEAPSAQQPKAPASRATAASAARPARSRSRKA